MHPTSTKMRPLTYWSSTNELEISARHTSCWAQFWAELLPTELKSQPVILLTELNFEPSYFLLSAILRLATSDWAEISAESLDVSSNLSQQTSCKSAIWRPCPLAHWEKKFPEWFMVRRFFTLKGVALRAQNYSKIWFKNYSAGPLDGSLTRGGLSMWGKFFLYIHIQWVTGRGVITADTPLPWRGRQGVTSRYSLQTYPRISPA